MTKPFNLYKPKSLQTLRSVYKLNSVYKPNSAYKKMCTNLALRKNTIGFDPDL
jgi:hypothetical protein